MNDQNHDSTTHTPCTECGHPLPNDVFTAAGALYGPSVFRQERLVSNIETEIQTNTHLPVKRTDQTTARYALEDWLGIRDLSSLTLAVLHQTSGECERVQTARIAADDSEIGGPA